MNVQKCANAASAYKTLTQYAISTLNLPNVAMYMDAGHAGWLGWSANISPAAQLFGQLYSAAGKPAAVRGLATNVANYNAWSATTCASYTQGDANCDEKKYINALAPLLTQNGFPAHFITDTCKSIVRGCLCRASTNQVLQLAMACNPLSNKHGATGAMSLAQVSVSALAPLQTTHFLMPMSGSSQVESVMVHPTPALPATMRIAATAMPFSPPRKPAPGSRLTLSSFSLMLTPLFKLDKSLFVACLCINSKGSFPDPLIETTRIFAQSLLYSFPDDSYACCSGNC